MNKNSVFLSGSLIYIFSNILKAFIPFLLLPVLTRYLSPEEYGAVAMFQVLLGALAAVVGLSMNGAAGRKFYDTGLGGHELKEFIGACLQILSLTSFIALLMILAVGDKLTDWLGLELKWLVLAVLLSASILIVQIRLGQWQVRQRAASYGVMQVSQSLVDMLLSLLLVVLFVKGADGRIAAQVLAGVFFALVALWMLKRDDLLVFFQWRPRHTREALKFGVPLIPHVAGVFLLASVDRFVINSELGLAKAGVYMVAVQFSMAVALLFDAINKAYVPWLFERLKRNDENEKRRIVIFTYVWFAFIFSGAILAFWVAPYFVVIVAGQDYAQAGEVIGWLILGQVFGGMYLMVTNYIFYSKRTGLLSAVTIFSGLINLGLLLFFIGWLGLIGAAYAFCAAMAIRFLLTWYVAQKRHPMPWFNLSKELKNVK